MRSLSEPVRAVAVMMAIFTAGLILVNGGGRWLWNRVPESGVARQQREDAAWYRYRSEQGCKLTGNTQTETAYHRSYLIGSSSTSTSYEWKCRGGDTHWRLEENH